MDEPAKKQPIEIEEQPLARQLVPNGKFHGELLSRIVARIRLAKDAVVQRYDNWDQVDEKVRLYMDLTRGAKRGDKTVDTTSFEMPFERSIVVPVSYSVLQVRLVQFMQILMNNTPMWAIQGTGPEDVAPARLMEAVIEADMQTSCALLSLYTMEQDAEKYGIGIIYDTWEQEYGYKVNRNVGPKFTIVNQLRKMLGRSPVPFPREWGVTGEGNRWVAIDPYRFWCDPRVPKSDFQNGEFAGHRTNRSYLYLLERSVENGGPYFNLEYLNKIDADFNDYIPRRDLLSGSYDLKGSQDEKDKGYYSIDLMQIKLIPREWGLGPDTTPEKWWFAVANESIIIRAHKSAYDHDKYTYGIIESNVDQHALYNPGMIESLDGLQRFMDWMLNSHVENIRRVLNDVLVYAPSLIEEDDLLNPGPARHVRLSAKGEEYLMAGMLQNPSQAITQLAVTDTTGSHLNAFQLIFNMVQRMTGVNDTTMAMPTAEKKTLGEVSQTVQNAMGRAATQYRLHEVMAFQHLVMRSISNRQQFTTLEQYYQLVGDALLENPGVAQALVNPLNIQGNFNYAVRSDLAGPDPARNAMVWVQLVMGMAKFPQAFAPGPDGKVLDFRAIFNEVARNMGIKNISQFYTQMPMMPPQNVNVMPDEQVANGVQQGNLVPMGPEPRLPGMPGMTP